jgi:erythromycin esterase-like protein
MTPIELGQFGFAIDIEPDNTHLDASAEIEKLGFTALWIHGGQLDRLDRLANLAHATEHAVIASSIIAPDVYDAQAVLDFYRQMESEMPDRFLVGLGAPQKPRAIAALGDYLDQLDAAESSVCPRRRKTWEAGSP